MIPETVLEAIRFATQRHHGQMRKDGKTPYVAHPYRVMFLLRHVFGVENPDVLAAGVLHDTIEDTSADHDDLLEIFGPRVAGYVSLLSKDPRMKEKEREEVYFDGLRTAEVEVKLCKLADTLDNLLDSLTLPPEKRRKTAQKAQQLLNLFEPNFPEEWNHVFPHIREAIRTANA